MSKLNSQQIKFCEEYMVNGYNGTQAYATAYSSDNLNVCAVEACKMLRKPLVVKKIKEIEGDYEIIGHSLGIDKKKILSKINEGLEAKRQTYHQGLLVGEGPDYNAVNNAIITWAKLTGEFEAEKKQITIEDISDITKDPSKMSPEEREEIKAQILKEL